MYWETRLQRPKVLLKIIHDSNNLWTRFWTPKEKLICSIPKYIYLNIHKLLELIRYVPLSLSLSLFVLVGTLARTLQAARLTHCLLQERAGLPEREERRLFLLPVPVPNQPQLHHTGAAHGQRGVGSLPVLTPDPAIGARWTGTETETES